MGQYFKSQLPQQTTRRAASCPSCYTRRSMLTFIKWQRSSVELSWQRACDGRCALAKLFF